MILWPSPTTLPHPSIDFGNKIASSVIRTKMETGRARQRARFTTGVRQLSASWLLTDAQWKIFQGIYHHYLTDGADYFVMPLPLGDGIQNYTVRFTDQDLSIKHVEVMHWEVSAVLETDVTCVVTKSALDALVTLTTV